MTHNVADALTEPNVSLQRNLGNTSLLKNQLRAPCELFYTNMCISITVLEERCSVKEQLDGIERYNSCL